MNCRSPIAKTAHVFLMETGIFCARPKQKSVCQIGITAPEKKALMKKSALFDPARDAAGIRSGTKWRSK